MTKINILLCDVFEDIMPFEDISYINMIKSVFDNMDKHAMKDHFTLGIIDDVTNTNLEVKNFHLSKKYKEIKVFGFGSDGMVSASKNILKEKQKPP